MAARVPSGRRTSMDHVTEALMHFEAAEAALGRIRDGNVATATRQAIAAMREAAAAGRRASADAVEALLDTRRP